MKEAFPVRLRAALLCLALVLLVSGCTPPPIPPPAPGAEPIEKPKNLEGVYRLMADTGTLPDMAAVPSSLIPATYGIADAWMADAVFMVAQDPLISDEIVLIRALSPADAEKILPLLTARLAQKETAAKDQAPDQYAMILDARLLHNNIDLALVVSAQADELLKVYEENWGV